MFRRVEDFLGVWKGETEGVHKMFLNLTDESLNQQVAPGHRNLGQVAWHVTGCITEMMRRTGLTFDGAEESTPRPAKATDYAAAYLSTANALAEAVKSQWNDQTLLVEDDMYGFKWARGTTARILIEHQIHHTGQMSILMRQAGLKVPGLYGPSQEEWGQYGMEAPPLG